MNTKSQLAINSIIIGLIIIVVNVMAQNLAVFWDLTKDNKYTLSPGTHQVLEDVQDVVLIRILLEGEFPAGFKRLQNRTREVIRQFRSVSSNIEYVFENPSRGSVQEINQRRELLRTEGVLPTNLLVREGDQMTEKLIYPYAIIQKGARKIPVNLLEAQLPNESEDVALNRSENLLEYKLISAINKLLQDDFPVIAMTTGHGELDRQQTAKLEGELEDTYSFGRLNLDSLYKISDEVDVLIVAKPTMPFTDRSKFIIDQYIMNGGKVIWLIDQFHVNLDSINIYKNYIPREIDHGLGDMFFKYGIRIQNNLVLDLENSQIPQVIGVQGDQVQTSLFPWYYHPLAQAASDHPVVKNINRVNMLFPSSIDTLKTKYLTVKTLLLSSSRYSRFQVYPMRLNFNVLKIQPDPAKFDKPYQTMAVLVEGVFESFYTNRVSDNMRSTLEQINAQFRDQSEPTQQIFVSDGDIIKNLYDATTNMISPIGYNKWEKRTYKGNSQFIMNAIEYLTDDIGLMETRSKTVELRLLDPVKIRNDRIKYQLINIVAPLFLLGLFGIIYTAMRRRKYSL